MCYTLAMASPTRTPKNTGARIILGMGAFEKISAIEGVRLKADSKQMFVDFDRRGLSADQRRREIIKKHARKA